MILFNGYYKKMLIAVCMFVAVFAGGWSASGQKSEVGGRRSEVGSQGSEVGGQRSEVGSQGSEVRSQEFCEERFEYFNDFIVHVKDVRKKDRILVCDVVIELNRGAKLSKERKERVDLRRIIYRTLKELLNVPGNRGKLKKEIKIRSNNFMGDEIIKSVYFTRFVLL